MIDASMVFFGKAILPLGDFFLSSSILRDHSHRLTILPKSYRNNVYMCRV